MRFGIEFSPDYTRKIDDLYETLLPLIMMEMEEAGNCWKNGFWHPNLERKLG